MSGDPIIMSTQKIYVGDIGTRIEFTIVDDTGVVVDISGAVSKTIDLQRPDLTSAATGAAASFTTDGTDGKMYYETLSGDISIEGTYKSQAYLDLTSWQGKAAIVEFEVDTALV